MCVCVCVCVCVPFQSVNYDSASAAKGISEVHTHETHQTNERSKGNIIKKHHRPVKWTHKVRAYVDDLSQIGSGQVVLRLITIRKRAHVFWYTTSKLSIFIHFVQKRKRKKEKYNRINTLYSVRHCEIFFSSFTKEPLLHRAGAIKSPKGSSLMTSTGGGSRSASHSSHTRPWLSHIHTHTHTHTLTHTSPVCSSLHFLFNN